MATPEQNTLLALQLFGAPAAQYGRSLDTRTNLIAKLMMADREEEMRRALANETNDRYMALARMQGDREDARWRMQGEREDARWNAQGKVEADRNRAREDSETKRAEAADKKALRNAIAATYPKYAAEATRLQEKVRPIAEFEETWEGLGDLQAEMARLEQARILRDQDAASTAAVGELDDAAAAMKAAKDALDAAMKPAPEDERFARARAVDAVRQVIEMGGLSGAPKADSRAAKNGIAALARGDLVEAGKLLGAEAASTYETAFQTSMQAAPNFKSRMQQATIAQQNFQAAQRTLAAIQSDLRRAAAANTTLATKLTTRRSTLGALQGTEEEAPKRRRSFEELTPPPVGAGGGPTTSTTEQPGLLSRGVSALMGAGGRALESVPGYQQTRGALGRVKSVLPSLEQLQAAPELFVQGLELYANPSPFTPAPLPVSPFTPAPLPLPEDDQELYPGR